MPVIRELTYFEIVQILTFENEIREKQNSRK